MGSAAELVRINYFTIFSVVSLVTRDVESVVDVDTRATDNTEFFFSPFPFLLSRGPSPSSLVADSNSRTHPRVPALQSEIPHKSLHPRSVSRRRRWGGSGGCGTARQLRSWFVLKNRQRLTHGFSRLLPLLAELFQGDHVRERVIRKATAI